MHRESGPWCEADPARALAGTPRGPRMAMGPRVPRAFPYPTGARVAGHAQRCGQDGASRGGVIRGGEGGGSRARPESRGPPAKDASGNPGAGFRQGARASGTTATSHFRRRGNPSRSVAWGGGGSTGGAVAPPLRAASGGPKAKRGDREGDARSRGLGAGWRTHYAATHPPARARA